MNYIRRGNIYALVVLLNQVLVMLLFAFFAPDISGLPYSIAISAVATEFFCFIPPLLIYLLFAKSKPMFSFKRLNLTNIIMIFFMSMTIQPVMTVLSAVSMIFFENPVSDYMNDLFVFPLPVALMALGVVPAIFEELTLRGVILKNHESLPIKKAAFVNGIFFGLMHLSPQQFLYAFMMGMVFSYFVYYTKSIWASILAHFTINSSQTLLGFLSYRIMENIPAEAIPEPTSNDIINTAIFLAVLTAIFLPVFLILFRTFIEYNRRRIFLDALAAPDDPEITAAELEPAAENVTETTSPKVYDWAFFCVIGIYLLIVFSLVV